MLQYHELKSNKGPNKVIANWSCAHEHVLQALERICQHAGYATSRKRVLPSEGNCRADLEVRNIRHDFIGAGRSGTLKCQLLNPDNLDRILESTASDKIRTYRAPYQRNRQVAFLPACISTSGRICIHGEFLRLLFFLSNKQADDYFAALGYEAHKEEFCHRRGVCFHSNRCAIGVACAQAVAIRGAPTVARRHVHVPRRAVGGGRGALGGVSNQPPGHRVADDFRWADRDDFA